MRAARSVHRSGWVAPADRTRDRACAARSPRSTIAPSMSAASSEPKEGVKTRAACDGHRPLEGSGARARRKPRHHWHGGLRGRPIARHAGAADSLSHVSSRSECQPTAGSHRPCTDRMNACRSVAKALEHEGNRGATGTEIAAGAMERVIPKPQPHQATSAAGVSVVPSLAHIGLARLKSRVHGDGSGTRAEVLLRRSSTRGTAAPLVRSSRQAPWSVTCRSLSLTKPREQPK